VNAISAADSASAPLRAWDRREMAESISLLQMVRDEIDRT
jgi:hypothetical protein